MAGSGCGRRSRSSLRAAIQQRLARALDGEALHMQQMVDALGERDVFGAVIAAATRSLERPQLRKPRFPVSQHMRRHPDALRQFDIGDAPVGLQDVEDFTVDFVYFAHISRNITIYPNYVRQNPEFVYRATALPGSRI